MATGEVKWFDRKKGFGFIRPDVGPGDVFVHVSAVELSVFDDLAAGQRLEFELTQVSDGRLMALGLRPIEPPKLPDATDGAA